MKQTLLLIEDDKTLSEALAMVLRAEGYEVLAAQSGEAGLSLLAAADVDLVLLDLRLPGIQGHDVLRIIRRQTPHLPVIVMTAHCQQDVRRELEELEIVALICKPFEAETIVALISSVLTGGT